MKKQGDLSQSIQVQTVADNELNSGMNDYLPV